MYSNPNHVIWPSLPLCRLHNVTFVYYSRPLSIVHPPSSGLSGVVCLYHHVRLNTKANHLVKDPTCLNTSKHRLYTYGIITYRYAKDYTSVVGMIT